MSATQTQHALQIEKRVVLRASRSRVWRALTDSHEFGAWFGASFREPFTPGASVRGRITTPGYENLPMDIVIDRIEPEQVFAFRWHPGGGDSDADYSTEPMTLVVFELADDVGGTLLKVTESGFEGVLEHRRAAAFDGNSEGWGIQMEQIAAYLDASP